MHFLIEWREDSIGDGCVDYIFFFWYRNIQEDVSTDAEISNGDDQRSGESPADKVEVADPDTKAVKKTFFWSFSSRKIICFC